MAAGGYLGRGGGAFRDPLLGRKAALGEKEQASRDAHTGFKLSAHSHMVGLRPLGGWYG